jgi:hypothetical protein
MEGEQHTELDHEVVAEEEVEIPRDNMGRPLFAPVEGKGSTRINFLLDDYARGTFPTMRLVENGYRTLNPDDAKEFIRLVHNTELTWDAPRTGETQDDVTLRMNEEYTPNDYLQEQIEKYERKIEEYKQKYPGEEDILEISKMRLFMLQQLSSYFPPFPKKVT